MIASRIMGHGQALEAFPGMGQAKIKTNLFFVLWTEQGNSANIGSWECSRTRVFTMQNLGCLYEAGSPRGALLLARLALLYL